jgi:hypothetical protein
MANSSQVTLTLEIERAGKSTAFEATSGAILVGSGSHCDVRLLPEEAAVEQLLVEAQGDRVFVRSLTRDGMLRIGGAIFEEGDLAVGTLLTLGELKLRIGVRTTQKRSAKAGESVAQTMITRAALMIGVAFGGYKVLYPDVAAGVLENAVAAPPLFSAAGNATCTVADDRDAAYQAQRWVLEGNLKQERAPFYPKDGVAGVRLYESAEACYRKAGKRSEADRVRKTLDSLRANLADEFHVRQVRLERFLQREKHDHAQREVQVLMAFVSHQDGPYVQWLGAVQRELNARFASAVVSR